MRVIITVIILLAWLIIPTGTPDDVITFWVIRTLGPQVYVWVIVGLLIIMWRYHINKKAITSTMKGLWRKAKRIVK